MASCENYRRKDDMTISDATTEDASASSRSAGTLVLDLEQIPLPPRFSSEATAVFGQALDVWRNHRHSTAPLCKLEREILARIFNDTMRSERVKLVKIERVQPKTLRAFCREEQKSLTLEREKKKTHKEYIMLHGTGWGNAQSIKADGLDPERGRSSKGSWLSHNAEACHAYAAKGPGPAQSNGCRLFAMFAVACVPNIHEGDEERSFGVWRIVSRNRMCPAYLLTYVAPLEIRTRRRRPESPRSYSPFRRSLETPQNLSPGKGRPRDNSTSPVRHFAPRGDPRQRHMRSTQTSRGKSLSDHVTSNQEPPSEKKWTWHLPGQESNVDVSSVRELQSENDCVSFCPSFAQQASSPRPMQEQTSVLFRQRENRRASSLQPRSKHDMATVHDECFELQCSASHKPVVPQQSPNSNAKSRGLSRGESPLGEQRTRLRADPALSCVWTPQFWQNIWPEVFDDSTPSTQRASFAQAPVACNETFEVQSLTSTRSAPPQRQRVLASESKATPSSPKTSGDFVRAETEQLTIESRSGCQPKPHPLVLTPRPSQRTTYHNHSFAQIWSNAWTSKPCLGASDGPCLSTPVLPDQASGTAQHSLHERYSPSPPPVYKNQVAPSSPALCQSQVIRRHSIGSLLIKNVSVHTRLDQAWDVEHQSFCQNQSPPRVSTPLARLFAPSAPLSVGQQSARECQASAPASNCVQTWRYKSGISPARAILEPESFRSSSRGRVGAWVALDSPSRER